MGSSSGRPSKNRTKHSRLKKPTVTKQDLISGTTDTDKGIDRTVCLSPASDLRAGLEGESLVYEVK